ncbi:MAG: DUF4115 domain-containing protein [Kangiellaceae bacterium]|nr:DUF4115 domain-containing protein [Kangiellaceae bacterium]
MDVKTSKADDKDNSINIGELLCEARDNLKLDSSRVAADLNLAQSIIENIERNVFEQDIPIAFIRGYIKSYATKVGLDTPKILAEFDRQTGVVAPSLKRVRTISKFDGNRKELNSSSFLIKFVSALVILSFLSFGGWELWKRFVPSSGEASNSDGNEIALQLGSSDSATQQDTSNTPSKDSEPGLKSNSKPSSESDQNQATLSASVVTDFSPDSNDENVSTINNEVEIDKENVIPKGTSTESKNSTPGVAQQMESNELISPGEKVIIEYSESDFVTLVLDFTADCWVRIVDGRGEVIALGVKNAGKHMPVRGIRPFNVVLGDPSVVLLQFNEQDFSLSGYRAGRRAEIILN